LEQNKAITNKVKIGFKLVPFLTCCTKAALDTKAFFAFKLSTESWEIDAAEELISQ
jgi:hypothetical protein